METVVLAFGSNMGSRREKIRAAVDLLEAAGVRVVKMSSFYETAPVGGVEQGDFINSSGIAETSLEPQALLSAIKEIEKELGRNLEGQHWGPRPVDIDIILFGRLVVNDDNLMIPHPLFAERLFVLEPLVEIAANFIMPDGRTVQTLFEAQKTKFDYTCQVVKKLS